MEKFQITDPPKVWVFGFLNVNVNGISASAIMKILKNGCHFHKSYGKISNYQPLKVSVFQIFNCFSFLPTSGLVLTFMCGYG